MTENCLQQQYVWEVPVRVIHWVNVLSIVVLSLTGIFIGAPKDVAHSASQYVMGWVRFIHFVAGYAFTISVVSRLYWSLRGNRYASWREFVPFLHPQGRRNMLETFRYYVFLERKPPHAVGHNTLAGSAYLVVFALYFVMIGSGFALYGQATPGSFWHGATGWLFTLFTHQGVRLTHHMVMWLLIGFAIHHVYSSWLMDVKERSGVMSSIFGGYKTVRTKE